MQAFNKILSFLTFKFFSWKRFSSGQFTSGLICIHHFALIQQSIWLIQSLGSQSSVFCLKTQFLRMLEVLRVSDQKRDCESLSLRNFLSLQSTNCMVTAIVISLTITSSCQLACPRCVHRPYQIQLSFLQTRRLHSEDIIFK